MRKVVASSLFTVLLAVAGASWAADLDSAKRDGLVGERADGYLGIVVDAAPSDVQRLVADVNERRRAEYERIASENGIAPSQVEALAAKKAIDKTGSGGWVYVEGEWRRK